VVGLVAACLLAVAAPSAGTLLPERAKPNRLHWHERIKAAERFADARAGRISFAVVDEEGKLRGDHVDRVHNSASVVKVMFMVALLREPDVRHDELTSTEKQLMGPMIKRSDNDTATAIYNRVGEDALYELAHDAGMESFTTQPTWGLTTITAKGQARFFYRLERYIPKRHRGYAMHLLTKIVSSQRWGIPPVAPEGWKLHFKGGWSGAPSWRVNQVMLLRKPPRRFTVAILTREQPSDAYGHESIQGVANRLLHDYNERSG
jgi:hypothetical protein